MQEVMSSNPAGGSFFCINILCKHFCSPIFSSAFKARIEKAFYQDHEPLQWFIVEMVKINHKVNSPKNQSQFS